MSEQPNEKPEARAPYERPAIVFEEEMQALASSCADCGLNGTKSSGGNCNIDPFDPCTAPFNS